MLDNLSQDLVFAFRSLKRNPLFTLVALVTIAAGVGATTTVFSVVNGVLLTPLPYGEPERLTRIYTRTGDKGTTGLTDGSRVAKDDARIEAIGTIDELNSVVGLLLCEPDTDTVRECLTGVQHRLFDIGGELSIPGHRMLAEDSVDGLERMLDSLNAELPSLKEFILPGGTRAAAQCHVARAVCRRAERRVCTLGAGSDINPVTGRCLNRLSDLLFVMARHLNRQAGVPDVFWQREQD